MNVRKALDHAHTVTHQARLTGRLLTVTRPPCGSVTGPTRTGERRRGDVRDRLRQKMGLRWRCRAGPTR